MKQIAFIGAGNMASAIIKGFLERANGAGCQIRAYDLLPEKAETMRGLGVVPVKTVQNAVSGADFLFLAVKPQNFEEALTEIKPHFSKKTVVVSIAAGITAGYIKKMLGADCKVVLVMPNTPLLLGAGASALAQIPPTSDAEFRDVCSIFEASGEIAVVPESKMKEIIAVNGSSPAFIYYFAKGFLEYAETVGIDPDAALKLFCQTLKGSAEMMLHSGKNVDELIEMVSSKGGTTVAGLERLEEHDLLDAVRDACEHCTKRAYELSKD